MWGIHVTKWLGKRGLLLFLAPHKVGFFKIFLFIRNGFLFFQIKCNAILRSGLILENIRKMFLLSIWATGTMYINFDEKHSPNVLEKQTRLQNIAYTTRKSLVFHVLCALLEQIPSGINQHVLMWAKNSNKLRAPSDLVTWIPHTV